MKRVLCVMMMLALLCCAVGAQAEWKVGDSFELGRWSMEGEAQPIKWTILSVNSVFLVCLADEPVAYYPWHNEEGAQNWGDSSLRQWLNEEFKPNAFNAAELKMVQRQLVVNTYNTEDPDAGLDTWDYVYIPTWEELLVYNPAVAPEDLANGTEWWLRNHGNGGDHAVYVDAEGSVQSEGALLTEYKAVRPVIVVLSTSLK